MDGHLSANRDNWDDRVPVHLASAFYDVEGWLASDRAPRPWEAALVGDVAGLDLVHLQCHFGLDTLTWAQAGARVTGVDFSRAAVMAAGDLAKRAGLSDRSRFVEADVLEAASALAPDTFDVVYVSLGALCWLPSVQQWAAQVARLLRPGGRLFFHDGHPLAWALADEEERVQHTYFEETAPFVSDRAETYTDGDRSLAHPRSYEWNHSVSEIITALLDHGLRIDHLCEHDWTSFPRFPWLVPAGPQRWETPKGRPRMPLSLTIVASRPGA